MKHLNLILSTLALLVTVYMLYVTYGFSEIVKVTCIFEVATWIFSLIVYHNVYRTNDKSTEKYLTWQNLLPDRAKVRKRLWVTALFSVWAIAIICILQFIGALERIGDLSKISSYLYFSLFFIISWGPLLLINLSWAKYNTLKDSKEIFEEIVKMLHEDKSYGQYFLKNAPEITPDTSLPGTLCQTDRDYFNIALFVNDLTKKYNFGIKRIGGCTYEKKYSEFTTKANLYLKSKKQEDGDNMIRAAMAFGREFCGVYKTVGKIAVWIHDEKTSRDLEEAQKMVND